MNFASSVDEIYLISWVWNKTSSHFLLQNRISSLIIAWESIQHLTEFIWMNYSSWKTWKVDVCKRKRKICKKNVIIFLAGFESPLIQLWLAVLGLWPWQWHFSFSALSFFFFKSKIGLILALAFDCLNFSLFCPVLEMLNSMAYCEIIFYSFGFEIQLPNWKLKLR